MVSSRLFQTNFSTLTLALAIAMIGFTFSFPSHSVAQGPGTEMTAIINRVGLGADCGRCKALAAEMDQRGAQWVLKNRSAVAERTIENATRLGHNMGPVKRMGVHMIIWTAARRAR